MAHDHCGLVGLGEMYLLSLPYIFLNTGRNILA